MYSRASNADQVDALNRGLSVMCQPGEEKERGKESMDRPRVPSVMRSSRSRAPSHHTMYSLCFTYNSCNSISKSVFYCFIKKKIMSPILTLESTVDQGRQDSVKNHPPSDIDHFFSS